MQNLDMNVSTGCYIEYVYRANRITSIRGGSDASTAGLFWMHKGARRGHGRSNRGLKDGARPTRVQRWTSAGGAVTIDHTTRAFRKWRSAALQSAHPFDLFASGKRCDEAVKMSLSARYVAQAKATEDVALRRQDAAHARDKVDCVLPDLYARHSCKRTWPTRASSRRF